MKLFCCDDCTYSLDNVNTVSKNLPEGLRKTVTPYLLYRDISISL